jgi:hypothetical protein
MYGLTHVVRRTVSKNISNNVEAIRHTHESAQIEKRQAKQSELFQSALAWLSPVDARGNHYAAQNLQQRGTGKWFMESQDFKHWKSVNNSLLWLYGSAGAGKTILSYVVALSLSNRVMLKIATVLLS